MITRASVHSGIESQILSTVICIFCFSSIMFCSQSVYAFLGLLPFPLIYAGLDCTSAGRPSVSLIYNKIIDCITKPLSIKTIWNRELSDLNLSVDWERVWSNLSLTSKNLAHRLIHFKVIHRAYITPYKIFKMKLQSNLNCHICNTTSSGTFLHMFWECPVVISLWTHVNLVLSSLLRIDWSVNPSLCLLNDDSGLCISSMQKRMLFAGFTAVKKTIIRTGYTTHV